MNAPRIAICLHGKEIPEIGDVPEGCTVFGHFVTENGAMPDAVAGFTKLTSSKSLAGSTREYRLQDVARMGTKAADWATLRHLDDSFALMSSVLHKKDHEVANNLRFDHVICISTDRGIGDLSRVVESNINGRPGTIRCDSMRERQDNNLWSVDWSLMSGSSRDIDTVSRFHHSYASGEFWDLTRTTEFDPAYRQAGLGALLWKWMSIRNLHAA